MFNKIKEFCSANIFFVLFNGLVFLFLTVFLFQHFQYAIIFHDDLKDLMQPTLVLYHCRYFSTFLALFFIKCIPNLLHIHPQNFAPVSEGLFKVLIFNISLIILSFSCFKFHKPKFFEFAFIFILSFFIVISLLVQQEFSWVFETFQYFFGYYLPFIFFVLFWHNISDLYLNKTTSYKKWLFFQIILLLLMLGNEIICGISAIFSAIVLGDFLITKKYEKIKYILIPLSIILIICFLYITNSNSLIVYKSFYNFSIVIPSFQDVKIFIPLLLKTVFLKNILLWSFLILSSILLFLTDNSSNKTNLFKLFLYSIISFLIFFILTIFINRTNPYTNCEYKFWFLATFVQLYLKLIIFVIILYFSGFIISLNKKFAFITYLILLLMGLSFSCIYFQNFHLENYKLENKELLYKLDKMSVHYLRNNKPAVISLEGNPALPFLIAEFIYNDANRKPEIYNKLLKLNGEDNRYLGYLKEVYNINEQNGMILTSAENAEKEFALSEGKFTQEELKKLDFSKI